MMTKPVLVIVICSFALLLTVSVLYFYGSAKPYSIQRHAERSSLQSRRHTPFTSNPKAEPLIDVPTLGPSAPQRRSNEAYVALQYGSFFLAIRVLGQSLRDSETTRDMVALCMPDVPNWQKDILRKDGWIVKSVNPLPKACVGQHVYSRHFVKVQTWLLTEYRRVILIDSDAIVLRNIDALFSCGKFCAAYRHSDLFNTGVVVLKPSVDTFMNICRNIQTIGSSTNGDQGFLNYFYKDLKRGSLFSEEGSAVTNREQFQRLPAHYNGDVSIFYLLNEWRYLDAEEPYVLHYTLGPVKPWKWWSYPLFSLNWKWKSIRDRLPPTQLTEPSLSSCVTWLPLALLLVVALSSKFWFIHYSTCASFAVRWSSRYVNPVSGCCTGIVPVVMLLTACRWAFTVVPITMSPSAAWTCFGSWILLFFFVPFSAYCHLAYMFGMHVPLEKENTSIVSCKQSSVTPLRIMLEATLWLAVSVTLFYIQFSVAAIQVTMKRRILTFFGLAAANVMLCYWWGKHLVMNSYNFGSSSSLLTTS